MLIILAYFLKSIKEGNKAEKVFFGLLIGGIIGNLIDRIMLGYVVDFIDFRIWPVFNLADSFVTISVIGLIFYLWKKK